MDQDLNNLLKKVSPLPPLLLYEGPYWKVPKLQVNLTLNHYSIKEFSQKSAYFLNFWLNH